MIYFSSLHGSPIISLHFHLSAGLAITAMFVLRHAPCRRPDFFSMPWVGVNECSSIANIQRHRRWWYPSCVNVSSLTMQPGEAATSVSSSQPLPYDSPLFHEVLKYFPFDSRNYLVRCVPDQEPVGILHDVGCKVLGTPLSSRLPIGFQNVP